MLITIVLVIIVNTIYMCIIYYWLLCCRINSWPINYLSCLCHVTSVPGLSLNYSFLIPSFYRLLVALFLHPITEVLYTAAAFGGLGDACIWTAQGNFITLISDAETIDRNWNIFWAMYQTRQGRYMYILIDIANIFIFGTFLNSDQYLLACKKLYSPISVKHKLNFETVQSTFN